jgi:SAM-dependent methyltransferase
MSCPICGAADGAPVLEAEGAPALCTILHRSRAEAVRAPRGRIALTPCEPCGVLYNAAFDPARVTYAGDYENALHFSDSFSRYAAELARSIAKRARLGGRLAVELGCGDGTFLAALAREGACRGLGFDPAHEPSRSGVPEGVDVAVCRELFRPGSCENAGLVCARHVLEHIDDPVPFVRACAAAMAADGHLYFEVPNGDSLMNGGGVFEVIYEHCVNYTAAGLRGLLERAGVRNIEIRSGFDGQYLSAFAGPAADATCDGSDDGLASRAELFGRASRDKVASWRCTLESLARDGRRVCLWGAGARGVMFLHWMGELAETVEAVVDVNPRKHGRFMSGSGRPIVGPDALAERQPDAVILANAVYKPEIERRLAGIGLRPELLA